MGYGFPNLYEQQRRNRRRTVLIMLLFVVFFGFLGYGFDLVYFGSDPLGLTGTPLGFPIATLAALGVGGISSFWGLQAGAKAVLSSAQAFPVPETDPKYQQLRNVVDEMTIASGLPRPAVYVITDPDPNAFATGKDPDHSYVAVTEGLVDKLNRDELQAVIAHEMSHIRNYDIRVMTVIAALVGAVFLLSDWGRRAMRFGAVGGGGEEAGRAVPPPGRSESSSWPSGFCRSYLPRSSASSLQWQFPGSGSILRMPPGQS